MDTKEVSRLITHLEDAAESTHVGTHAAKRALVAAMSEIRQKDTEIAQLKARIDLLEPPPSQLPDPTASKTRRKKTT